MKKTAFIFVLIIISCLLLGCIPRTDALPVEGDYGEAKSFSKVGVTLTLTDKFEERRSEQGFDAYYASDFCGVVILKEEFTLEEGLAERSLREYIGDVIENNGHTDVEPTTLDGLVFYERTITSSYARSYCYKGADAFYIVQFICRPSDGEALGDVFHSWAKTVVFE